MTHTRRFFVAAALVAGLYALPAYAAYTGPQDMPRVLTTSRQVLEFPIDDHAVELEGHIVKQLGHDKYLFRDDSGALRLEIDANIMPAQDFDDKNRVKVYGEIDSKALDTPQVDVERIDILK